MEDTDWAILTSMHIQISTDIEQHKWIHKFDAVRSSHLSTIYRTGIKFCPVGKWNQHFLRFVLSCPNLWVLKANITWKSAMGIAVNGFSLNQSLCHIIVHYGTTCHSLTLLCFSLSTLWWLHWGWVGSVPGSDESVTVHMNKHISECHKMDISWAYSLLPTSLRDLSL